MPTLSEFYGIKITMNWDDFGVHKKPHNEELEANWERVINNGELEKLIHYNDWGESLELERLL